MKQTDEYIGVSQSAAMFGMYLAENMREDSKLHVLSADMSLAASLDRFIYQYPTHYTNVGIAEQNLVAIASGLASEGFHPIAIAQASFITMRAFEMDRQYLGYMQNPVILVGLNSGFALQYFGNTHYGMEDIAIMRTIPGMMVISPADAGEAVMALEAAIDYDGPVYIRLTGGAIAPTVYKETCDFKIGKNIVLRDGKNITIFATGALVGYSLQAADILTEKFGLSVKVVDVHTIKPLDIDSIKDSKKCKLIVSVEEHNVIGGLGSAIAEFISGEIEYPPLLKLGVQDTFSSVGSYTYLMNQHRLTSEYLAEDIILKYNSL